MLGVFLDTETNGLDPTKHQILEIAYTVIDLLSGREIVSFHSVIRYSQQVFAKSDPVSLQINGFSFNEIDKGQKKEIVKNLIISSFQKHHVLRKKAVFICQNPSFDRSFFAYIVSPEEQEKMQWPYHWLDLASMYWGIAIHKEKKPWNTGISKDNIATAIGLDTEPHPHRAENGVKHLIQCYEKLVGYPNSSYDRFSPSL
jgi:oligoribonuclease